MSTSYAVIIALVIGLVCGFAASESSYRRPRGLISRCRHLWYGGSEAVGIIANRRKSTADTVRILQIITDAERRGERIAVYRLGGIICEDEGIDDKQQMKMFRRLGAIDRSIDQLIEAGVVTRITEGEGSPEEEFLVINNGYEESMK
jgi:hypothetical protein